MTTQEAADRLGLSVVTVRHQIANGALRAEKRGRDYWLTEAAVRDYAERHQGRVGRPRKV